MGFARTFFFQFFFYITWSYCIEKTSNPLCTSTIAKAHSVPPTSTTSIILFLDLSSFMLLARALNNLINMLCFPIHCCAEFQSHTYILNSTIKLTVGGAERRRIFSLYWLKLVLENLYFHRILERLQETTKMPSLKPCLKRLLATPQERSRDPRWGRDP